MEAAVAVVVHSVEEAAAAAVAHSAEAVAVAAVAHSAEEAAVAVVVHSAEAVATVVVETAIVVAEATRSAVVVKTRTSAFIIRCTSRIGHCA